MKKLLGFLLGVLFANGLFADSLTTPLAIYLTWRKDPSTSMVIQWIEAETEPDQALKYQKIGDETTYVIPTESRFLRDGLGVKMHWVELTELEADSDYRFWWNEKEDYRFKTLPKDVKQGVRFAVGGDAYNRSTLFHKMNGVVAKQNPAFVILGGDIAYAHGHRNLFSGADWDWERWQDFLKAWSRDMRDQEGRLIPLVPVVGNHDIRGSFIEYLKGNRDRPLFYDLFIFKEDMVPYRMFEVGGILSLFLLDSGHSHSIEGDQKVWLEEQLKAHQNTPFKLAVYHVPAYPGMGKFDRRTPVRLRTHWSPLFEEGGLQAAFEHHSHVYKRTVPIRNNAEDASGVVYLGDGSWGSPLRKPLDPAKHWYIAKSQAINAAFIIDVTPDECIIRAISNKGRFFDELKITPAKIPSAD